jgi:hypothetical protein
LRRARNGAKPPAVGTRPAEPYGPENQAALASGVNSAAILRPAAEAAAAALLASGECPPDLDPGRLQYLGKAVATSALLREFLAASAAVDPDSLTDRKRAQRARRIESAERQLLVSDEKVKRLRTKFGLSGADLG